MKIFSNKYTTLFGIALLGVLTTACSDDKNGGGSQEPSKNGNLVTIETEVYTRSNVVLELNDGSTMNVYVKSGTSIDAADYMPSVKANRAGSQWTTTPEIRVEEGRTISLFAVSPYNEANTDPKAIPFDTKDQVDLLYSGEFVPASYQTPRALFHMRHALTLLSFNITTSGLSDAGSLTSLSVAGSQVYTSGKLNIQNGKIEKVGNTQVTVSTNAKIQAGGWTKDLPGVWTIPFDNSNQGVSLTATINGKTYVATVPPVNTRQGFQYVFHLVLTPNGLVFDPSATEEVSLNVFDDEIKPMEGYGAVKFGFTGTTFSYPFFDGEQIFGNIKSGDAQGNYSIGGTLDIPGSGVRDVTVETWNTNGFELPSIEGIESIDISAY